VVLTSEVTPPQTNGWKVTVAGILLLLLMASCVQLSLVANITKLPKVCREMRKQRQSQLKLQCIAGQVVHASDQADLAAWPWRTEVLQCLTLSCCYLSKRQKAVANSLLLPEYPAHTCRKHWSG
jgi:hypothetical protein